eukprot:TRINITY_DN23947_c0_g1_i1.p1 TRINITY_DN23947_c0_g1~~TRINITY_DN23947_c0_g1_i1.p1  ORF type:complete len:467 (+),score=83.85 TRINITY_DN23947_c0_g1_i1:78-1478(+)
MTTGPFVQKFHATELSTVADYAVASPSTSTTVGISSNDSLYSSSSFHMEAEFNGDGEPPKGNVQTLADEEVARILVFLDHSSLLQIPATSQGLREASAARENWLWERLLLIDKRLRAGTVDVVEDDSVATTGASSNVSLQQLPRVKEQFRLRQYFVRQRLHNLDDALRAAADYHHMGVLKLLIRAGANVNACADSGAWGVGFTQVGAFALHLAAKRSHTVVLDALIEANADVDVVDQNGRTALMVAAASGQTAAVEWLVRHNAAANVSSHYGYTALHYASLLPRPEMIELLLGAGALPSPTDRMGQTPLHVVLNGLPRRSELTQETSSCDPSGFGDEYCYCRDTSHGYTAEEARIDEIVKRAATALVGHGASVDDRDDRGNLPRDILQAKRRPDLAAWLDGIIGSATHKGEQRAPLVEDGESVAGTVNACATTDKARRRPERAMALVPIHQCILPCLKACMPRSVA